MSDEKKPGLRDISNLKARLGMLNKGGATPAPSPGTSNPFAPKPAATDPGLDLSTGFDGVVGGDTAIVRIDPIEEVALAPSAPVPAPAAPTPSKPPGPSPLSSGGFSLGDASELFKKKEPTPAPKAVSPVSQPSREQLEAAFAQQAPVAPAIPAQAPPPANAGFANPLQAGQYRNAPKPIDLSAEDEAGLSAFVDKQVGIQPKHAMMMVGAAGLLALFFGFFIGNARDARRLVNAQIDASIIVAKRMQDPLQQLTQVLPIVKALAKRSKSVEWDKVKAIPAKLPQIDASIIATPIPLEPDLTRVLNNSVTDINILFSMLRDHRSMTLSRDKAEIESLLKGDSFGKFKQYAVYSKPPDPKAPPPAGIPPKGRIVALVGKPVKEGEEFVIPVRRRESTEPSKVLVRGLTLIQKTDLLSSGKANVINMYTKRVEGLNTQLKKIELYLESLKTKLKEQAAREKVFSL